MKTFTAVHEDDWSLITKLLPDQWREKAKEMGALQRFRAFPDVDSLLRTLLDHVAQGYSFRDTAMRAKWLGCTSVSDVAIWKRLRASGTWLRWLAEGVMKMFISPTCWTMLGEGRSLRMGDGTTVQEPGSKGISWRLHYSIDFPSLMCTEVLVTGVKIGESFKRFKVSQGDIWMGDRGFGHASGIAHVVIHGGDVIVRVNLTNVRFQDGNGQRFPLLESLGTLSPGQVGDWDVWVPFEGALIPGRICAKMLNNADQEKAIRKCRQRNGKKGNVKPETLEAARYIIIFTTLDRSISAKTVLSCYEARWQIELVFKRLKSLLQLGHLRKKNTETARAWIHAKLLLAFLIEAIQRAARAFTSEEQSQREEQTDTSVSEESSKREPSRWRITRLIFDGLKHALTHSKNMLGEYMRNMKAMEQQLSEPHRKRVSQLSRFNQALLAPG
jgi:hypothetical protein